ncbi:MAG: multicopper oxidase domain-containing protein [Nitrospirae bacterium]|nr:multicopper oxidase domain-containing protein [Nitrospirota bacterium]
MKHLLTIISLITFLAALDSPAHMDHSMMTEPPDAGVKEFTLTAREISWEILPGVKVNAATFNGLIPGTEIKVREGNKVRIRIINELKEPTAVHWHGIDVPYNMDGVPGVTQEVILPGKEFVYEFIAKPAGVRFYHSHYKEASQMTNAMHGAFIIEPVEGLPVNHHTFFITEWSTGKDAHTKGIDYYTMNGKSFPATGNIAVKKGERVRITFVNIGAQIHPMHLHGHQFMVVAKDGNPVPAHMQEKRNVIPLLPGESYDIEFTADNPGVWALHCHEPHHVMNDDSEDPGGLITLIVYEGYEAIAEKAKDFLPADKENPEETKPMRH